ncbi:hypothetical protein EMIHUDRAFT_232305 [Emiliania huxleyi CCMP1516]|uniref:Uncharacterized protein n=2 Tax=Emiliania huxleyi TaxID=2903 RepID=A0A0D3K554_EMIH1|nr:hypothetical protein EMIHUDRAFT_232305 [Emiliania huxleyi CCMP1516]EOD30889.1 hypothetical protein EMIHUDRAFT_232305 [Emiliania huxleyi CCMP1516]|eukprot:XP_005783318.1 hypothetical protein EMIHUDRAFT_232305 [Emiliania huxleyi CCMP1516]
MRQAAAPAASSPKKAGQGFSAHVGAKAAQAAALQALHTLRRAQPAPCVSRAQVSPARPLQVASSLFYEGIGHFDGARYEEALVCFEQALAINEKYLLPASSGYILCCNNIAAVHERMSNPPAAEFEWRAGEGSSEEEDAGPLDDRVEGAIDAINAARDAMNARQLDLEAAKRELGAAEAQRKEMVGE